VTVPAYDFRAGERLARLVLRQCEVRGEGDGGDAEDPVVMVRRIILSS
jgi:hypothetical protein